MADLDTSVEHVKSILQQSGTHNSVSVLSALQEEYHYLPEPALKAAAEITGARLGDLVAIAGFYERFRLRPAGEHRIRVCTGTACFVKGADQILSEFRNYLRIAGAADTDNDGLFTVESAACLGCCMLAPAVQVDEKIYGHVTRAKVPAILAETLAVAAHAGYTPGTAEGASIGTISLCTCSSCRATGALDVLVAFRDLVARDRRPVLVTESGCSGLSYRAPLVVVRTRDDVHRYGNVEAAHAEAILDRHFPAAGIVAGVKRLASGLARSAILPEEHIEARLMDLEHGEDSIVCSAQSPVVTAGADLDPLDLDAYRDSGGFVGLGRCAHELTPEQIIEEIDRSGLRGRGGAGYPASAKWEAVRRQQAHTKYMVCNADEGDPGAFMDRMILESFPFRVIEGMSVAGIATGATRGICFIRAEYPLALRRVRAAIELCRRNGVLGDSVLGSSHAFDIDVAEGYGAFVCGEESALVSALEGRRPVPRFRPPYPSEVGYLGAPTLINNVETLATVPWILANGADAYGQLGTENARGTKTFALAGKIRRGGLIEVEMGTTLRRIVNELGGGVQEGHTVKAIQIGGPSGGCIPASLLDTPVDYSSLTAAGAMMGSGGMVVLDETDCMVEIARYFLEFTQAESCGSCTCCRIGTAEMLAILTRLCGGTAKPGDIGELEQIAMTVKAGSLCGLGKTAPNPVLTSLRYFREEFDAHLEGHCPAGRCRSLIAYEITDACIGCTLCATNCPVGAIEPAPLERHRIDPDMCIHCGTCASVCQSDAVTVVRR